MKVATAATLDPGSGGLQFHLSETSSKRGFQLLCSGFGGLCVRLLKLHVAEELKVASRFWDREFTANAKQIQSGKVLLV